MNKREKILRTPEYWFEYAQNELYERVANYLEREKITQSELAERLGVTKGYMSQVMRGQFNYTLKKLIELSLAVGCALRLNFKSLDEMILQEHKARMLPFHKAGKGVSIRSVVSAQATAKVEVARMDSMKTEIA